MDNKKKGRGEEQSWIFKAYLLLIFKTVSFLGGKIRKKWFNNNHQQIITLGISM